MLMDSTQQSSRAYIGKTSKTSTTHILNISKATTREKNPFFGKQHTDVAKEKNRKAHLGKKHSIETKEKCRQAALKYWSKRNEKDN